MKVVTDLLVKTRYRVANLGGLSNIVISDHIVVTLIRQCLLVSRYLINVRVSQRSYFFMIYQEEVIQASPKLVFRTILQFK